MSDIIWGNMPQKSPKKGVNRHFQAKLILKLTYLGRVLSDFYEIWHGDVVRPSKPSPSFLKFRKSKMVAAAILENRKITIPRLRLERFHRNLAQWCSLTLLNVPAVKNLKILKSTMAAAAILKNWKVAILRGFELITVNCKSDAITTRLMSHKLPHQCVTCSF